MRTFTPCRLVLVAVLAAGVPWMAAQQTNLPATEPTGSTGSVAPVRRASTKAEIDYTGGMLRITANNSSLNQILRDVGRQTGMKITGGVQDDRVFGSYGPAPASQVLASLLDGTSSNLLIVENDSNGPAELILTPRRGGATPPNPNASAGDDYNQTQQPTQQYPQPQTAPQTFQNRPEGGAVALPGGLPPSNGGQTGTPIDGGANLGTTPGAFPGFGQTPPDATAQPAAAEASQPQSPNGVSTPQQIYEQLQKLRQQQGATTPQ